MYRSHLRFKCFKKKRFSTFSFSNYINDPIHEECSLHCAIVLQKYNNYVNTSEAISQTSVDKHNPT